MEKRKRRPIEEIRQPRPMGRVAWDPPRGPRPQPLHERLLDLLRRRRREGPDQGR